MKNIINNIRIIGKMYKPEIKGFIGSAFIGMGLSIALDGGFEMGARNAALGLKLAHDKGELDVIKKNEDERWTSIFGNDD